MYPKKTPITGELKVPADKSLTHRAYILSAIAKGKSEIVEPLRARDCNSTMECLIKCGINFQVEGSKVTVTGKLREPEDVLDAGNSGTTARILTGLLSSFPFFSVITGDDSLRKRPMKRVIEPLRKMGAIINGREGDSLLPIAIKGGKLRAIDHQTEVASAQVKSAIILAGLKAEGKTIIREPMKSRDHTERMLKALGANVRITDNAVEVEPSEIEGFYFKVPKDPSSCAFLVAVAILTKGSHIIISDVLLNPTRIGFFEKLKEMGCNISWHITEERLGEPIGIVEARYTPSIKPANINKEEVPYMIDEIPIFVLIASQADGETIIRGAEELRVKESDRIKSTVSELKKIGVDIEELPDGMIVRGPSVIKGGAVYSHKDHRIAMTLAVSGLISKEGVEIEKAEWVDISFPGFFQLIT